MLELTNNDNEAVDTTPRTWIHSRKGKIVGYVTGGSEDGEWTFIHVTEDGYWFDAGETATARTALLTEVK